jgi:beta-xylosidase
LVDTPDGQWWFYHFQDTPILGRVVHLQPVHWQDDWPLMGVDVDGNGVGEPVAMWHSPLPSQPAKLEMSDDFTGPQLGLQWQWNHNPVNDHWSLTERKGWLTLHALSADSLKASRNMLTQKVVGYVSESTTLLSSKGSCYAGLFCIGKQFNAIGLCPQGIYTEFDGKKTVIKTGKYQKLYLRVTNDCLQNRHQFWYSTDGQLFTPVGNPFPMRAGYWKGIRTGLYCYGSDGQAQFDYFQVQ